MNDIRDDVQGTLRHLGFCELRPTGGDEWAPLDRVNGQFGTTAETTIIHRKGEPTARLVDRESGETVATARRSCAVGT
jgi:hypothetical protein